jgi:hypothetical protein
MKLIAKPPRLVLQRLVKIMNLLKGHDIMCEKSVFIWGIGRSGTHLLYDILSLHPSLMCAKTNTRWKKGLWGSMHWGDSTPDKLKGYGIPYEGFQRFWRGAGLEFEGVGMVLRHQVSAQFIQKVSKRYATLHQDWFWKRGTRYRILDKSPMYILMIEAIDAVFPDSYHIFCLRDPRAILNSLLRIYRFRERDDVGRGRIDEIGFWGVVPPGYEAHQHEPLVPRLCWQIQALHDIGFGSQALLQDRLIAFRYESLLHEAHQATSDLFQRLALPDWSEIANLIPQTFPDYSPPWPRPGEPVHEPYGKVRCYLDEEMEQVTVLNELAVQLGYDPNQVGAIIAEPIKQSR